MSKFRPELELQFRLLENTIIKQNLNYFRKRKNFETVYEDQILEQIELEQNRLKRENFF